MTRAPFRFPIIESLAILGIFIGAWLIQQTFQPSSDLPNRAFLAIGALDILFCIAVLGYLLRERLRGGKGLSRAWILTGSVLLAGFLGWNAALMIDAERLLAETNRHREYDQQLARLEDSLRHFSEAVPAATQVSPLPQAEGPGVKVDKKAWQVSHDRFAVLHDQLQSSLRGNPEWEKSLARVHEQVQEMHRLAQKLVADSSFDDRMKRRGEYVQARDLAVQHAEALRAEIAESGRELTAAYHGRWQSIGGASLTGVFAILGCLLMWLVFDNELRRGWQREAQLAQSEARFRDLVERAPDAVAVLDADGLIVYVNRAWKLMLGCEPNDLLGRRFMDLVHADDRPRIYAAWNAPALLCRLSAGDDIWQHIELQIDRSEQASVVRCRDRRPQGARLRTSA